MGGGKPENENLLTDLYLGNLRTFLLTTPKLWISVLK
jgi:hypothetical protein